ncbi:hypothetical protein [uncultured Fibrobacter sp.]|uniref:hypothetical protein n=1 Tax=uncultured Fibrobacter sp. TaxID=261512 RepID=UPI002626458B|nr:hypothetical protein [uncultured Fibrobacter sp.]
MSELHIDCPHCGTSFDASIQGDSANMMVFCCARCKTPLMYYHGEVAELDRKEFAGLRKKLSRAIDAVVNNGGAMGAVAEALKKMVDASEALAEERSSEKGDGMPVPREGSAPSEFENEAEKFAGAMLSNDAEPVRPAAISDDTLADLQKNLDELDVDSFLAKL